ncbi:MAG: NADH-quinone oxidoreductase subunit J [Planctomycetaceae bacterium]|nr:NADH-quinone oxidoreductase subunit J [Planctomycetaceae bacterium]
MGPINWQTCFFFLMAAIACGAAIAVVISSNIVRMACWLVLSLAAVAGLFFLTGAEFLGAVQLMVYVGGTMVLLIFGVMLTARGPFVSMKIGAAQWVVAVIAAGALLTVLLQAAFGTFGQTQGKPIAAAGSSRELAASGNDVADAASYSPLGLGLIGVRIDRLAERDHVLRGGMSGYLLPFEIISVHLVVVLVGAAYLARARRRMVPRHWRGGEQPSGVED